MILKDTYTSTNNYTKNNEDSGTVIGKIDIHLMFSHGVLNNRLLNYLTKLAMYTPSIVYSV